MKTGPLLLVPLLTLAGAVVTAEFDCSTPLDEMVLAQSVPGDPSFPSPGPLGRDPSALQRPGLFPFFSGVREQSSLRDELRQPASSLLRSPQACSSEGVPAAWRSGRFLVIPRCPSPDLHVRLCLWLI